jgi:hypothetical protein
MADDITHEVVQAMIEIADAYGLVLDENHDNTTNRGRVLKVTYE